MAISTTAELVDFIMSEIVESIVISAGYEQIVAAPLVRAKSIAGEGTESAKFSKDPLLTAAAVAEGTDLTPATYDPTSVTVSTSEIGIRVDPTDRSIEASAVSPAQIAGMIDLLVIPTAAARQITRLLPYAEQCAMAVRNLIDTLILAEVASAGSTAGTSGAAAQFDDYFEALFHLESNKAIGRYAAVLHPKQLQDLRGDSTNNAATAFSLLPEATKVALLNARSDGFVANILGVDVYRSTLVADVNAAADHGGIFMPTGAENDPRNLNAPIAMVLKRGIRAEAQRDASARLTEIVVTASIGIDTVDPTRLVSLETDHV